MTLEVWFFGITVVVLIYVGITLLKVRRESRERMIGVLKETLIDLENLGKKKV